MAVASLVRHLVPGIRLREDPGIDGRELGTLAFDSSPDISFSYVVDGPVSADGYEWYRLSGQDIPWGSGCSGAPQTDPLDCPVYFGWAAAGDPAGEPWLETVEPDCPEWTDRVRPELDALNPVRFLACYGAEERSIVGFFPQGEDPRPGDCDNVPEEIRWLGCVDLSDPQIYPDPESTVPGTGLVFAVDEITVAMPEGDQWVRLTGRFDHPAAQQCTFGDPPEQEVRFCRARFVVESAEAVPAP